MVPIWVLVGIGLTFLISLAYATLSGAPWVPTWKRDIARTKNLLNLQEGEVFYELGCGDGRICLTLADQTKADIRGIELSLLQYCAACVRKTVRRSSAKFIFGNVFKKDVSDADAVYLFLMPEAYKKIAPKLERELRPGTRVVSYVWPIPGWQSVKVDSLDGSADLHYYVR
jgi:hypothetical protein